MGGEPVPQQVRVCGQQYRRRCPPGAGLVESPESWSVLGPGCPDGEQVIIDIRHPLDVGQVWESDVVHRHIGRGAQLPQPDHALLCVGRASVGDQ